MEKKYIINLRLLFLIVCIYLFIFQNFLQTYIPLFQFYDEILALISLPIILTNLMKRKTSKLNLNIIIVLFIIILLGVASNLIFNYQTLKFLLFDMLLCLKFYLIYFFTEIIWKKEFLEKNKKTLKIHLSINIIILVIFTILNYVFVLWPNDFRFGLLSNKLFYSHPTYLAGISIFLLSLSIRINKKVLSLQNILIILILISTLRLKAIGTALAILVLSFQIEKTNKKLSFSKIILVGVILFCFAFDQINYYFFQNDGFARKELLNTSIEIATDYFPLGTGFGTFGSYYSGESYSPIYYKYGLNRVYGLSPKHHPYISDSFYPMILGQFGYLGLILYVYCIFILFKKIQQIDFNNNKYEYISKICVFTYLIISSTSESAFAGPIAMSLALSLGFKD